MAAQRKVQSSLRLSLLVATTTILSLFVVQTILHLRAEAADGIHKQISFQGKLQNSDGTNVSDGNYSVTFTLYDAASSGTNLWDETQTVSTTDGIFRVSLGSVDTTLGSVNFNTDSLYLGIKVGSDSEMTPRVRFTAVPYAFNAQKVNGLTVTNTSDNPFSSTTTLKIGDGKTVVLNNSITLSGTDGKTYTFPAISGSSDTVVTEGFAQTLTNKTIGSTGLTFSGATTDITTGTDEDFVITPDGTGNVGIGTTDPLGYLTIAKDGGSQLIIDGAGSGSYGFVMERLTGTTDQLVFRSVSTGTDTTSTNNILVLNRSGNVGIGTNNPLQKLYISGQAYATSGFGVAGGGGISADANNFLNVSNGAATPARFSSSKGVGIILDANNDETDQTFVVQTNSATLGSGTELLRIQENGNVGVGTTSPIGKLQLYGSATGKALAILDERGDQDVFTASASGTTVFTLDRAGRLYLADSSAPSPTTNRLYAVSGNLYWNGTQLGSGGSCQWTTVNTNEIYYSSGNVGIGTTDPGAPLHIVGNAPDANNGSAFEFAPTLTSALNNQNGLRVSTVVNVSGNVDKTFTGIAGNISSSEAGTDLDDAVLIGLRGYAYISGAGSFANVQGGNYTIELDAAGTISNGYGLVINDAAKSAGNINQLYGLAVAGQTKGTNHSITASLGQASGATNNINLLLGQSTLPTGNWSLYNGSSYANYFAGNVGIGTTNTSSGKLEVAGALYIGDSGGGLGDRIVSRYNNQNTIEFAGSGGLVQTSYLSASYQLDNDNNDTTESFEVRTNGNSKTLLKIDAEGNVGIGTTTTTGAKITISDSGTAPGVDMQQITSSGGVTTSGVDGLQIAFTQGDDADATDTNSGLTINMTSSSGDADTLYGINIGNITGGSATERGLRIGTGWDVGIVVESGGITLSGGSLTYTNGARPTKTISLQPEYSGGVITAFYGAGTDSSITGSLTTDADTSATNSLRTYYEWNSSQGSLNYYTVAVRVKLPKDFSAWTTSNALQVDHVTESTSASNNVLDIRVYLESDVTTAVAADTGNVSAVAGTWRTETIDDSVLDDGASTEWDAADETAVIYLRMGSLSDNYSRIGEIKLNYLASF